MAKTVLILDDDPILQQSLMTALQSAGYDAMVAADGKVGLEVALDKYPDLVLTDNLMPIMGGVEMIEELRKDSWGATVPVLLMTNMYDVNAVNQTFQTNTDYVMKSDISLDKVIDLVQNKIGPA